MARGLMGGRLHVESKPAPQVDSAEVARVAYELYEQRGRQDGRDLEDWLQAEAIVRARSSARSQAASRRQAAARN